ncbi:MAG: HesA/MoeB/ThiF family protein [Deltaproteobacteria bacterium]|nr:HesA/MoeB/ThiF family protein [Deltaproteobacteria bacterium]
MNVAVSTNKRFSRQLLHDGFAEDHQERLRSSTVLLAGAGGVGGQIAYGLVGAGIGKLILIHSGDLEIEDLNRQTVLKESAIGLPRVEAAAERLREYSSSTIVEGHDMPITTESLAPLLKGVDLIIDARHNFPERRAMNRAAFEKRTPLLFTAMDALEAQMALFVPGSTGCLECLYPDDPPYWDPLAFPVFGAVAHALGAFAAMEAIKYVTGFLKPTERLCLFDMGDYSIRKVKYRRIEGCPVCALLPIASVYASNTHSERNPGSLPVNR